MAEKKHRNFAAIGLGAVSIVLAIVLVLMTFGYIPTMQGIESDASLINVALGASDDPVHSVLKIQGYVVNGGSSSAYKSLLHVVAYYVSGAKAVDTWITIGNGVVNGKSTVWIDANIPYSPGDRVASSSAELTPQWSNTP